VAPSPNKEENDMLKPEILDWIKSEFLPVRLATPSETIYQMIDNSIRYWNTHSAFPIVEMYTTPITLAQTNAPSSVAIQLSPAYKNVVKVYPATTPDWILQNYPLWTLLGITIIDNLTSDLVMLSEAFRNYRYYIGTDFQWHFVKSDNPTVGGVLNYTNSPYGMTQAAVVGTKRIIEGLVQLSIIGTNGILTYFPVEKESVILTNGTHTYVDDGLGNLISSLSGYSGTINYATGVWSVSGWSGKNTGTVQYLYNEDIKSEYILDWILRYTKALVKMVEGNTIRKTQAIGVAQDGQQLYEEGKTEREELEKRLSAEGRWMSFVRRF